jgi:alkaline phosphatase D
MNIDADATDLPDAPQPADPASLPRRHLLAATLAAGLVGACAHPVGKPDVPRFGLGVASGFPRPDGMVLWTRLTGADLPQRVEVQWELAGDEAFREVVARGSEAALGDEAHSVHVEPGGLAPGRWYWYRFRALGDQSPVGRTRTAPAPDAAATLEVAIASCQRYDVGRYAAWRHMATEPLDLVMFLGDYIYETASRPDALRQHVGGQVKTLADYRARYAQYKADPQLQAAHAACPWLFIWDDHEVENDYAGGQSQTLAPGFLNQRAAAYQAWWEHLPIPRALRPVGPDARIYGAHDWGRLARILAVDGRQYRDPQVCPKPGRGGSNTVTLQACPALADPARSFLGLPQERWLASAWDTQRPWNLLAQPTLMARFAWSDPAGPEGGTWWTDGWDGYAPARARLLGAVAERRISGAVVLGGDVHSHYVANLKTDFADPRSPVIASEFCGTSITSTSLPQERVDAARAFNPHILLGRSDQRGYIALRIDAKRLEARLMAVAHIADPLSAVNLSARFSVDPRQPGPQAG